MRAHPLFSSLSPAGVKRTKKDQACEPKFLLLCKKNEKLLNINVWDIIQKSLLADQMQKSTVM